jgi:hypothetical protein
MLPRHAIVLALVSSMVVGGCVTTAPGRVASMSIHVSTNRLTPPASGWGAVSTNIEPVVGATCTVRNDHGARTVTTPGDLEIEASGKLFHVACKHEGFREERIELACLTRGEEGALAGLRVAAFAPPLLIFALPVAAAMALASPEAHRCALEIRLTPSP